MLIFIQESIAHIGEIGLAMAKPFGVIGSLLFAAVLFVTCLGASFECSLALSYNIAQGFGWKWGENKKPVQAARFNLVIVVFLLIAFIIGSLGFDPLQLALFASTVIALFLPISLLPFLVIMNDPQLETRDKKNIGRVADIEAVWREDGTLMLTDLVTGPQALAGRIARPLRTLFQRLLRDHFEQRIPLKEIEEFGPTLRLHKTALMYGRGGLFHRLHLLNPFRSGKPSISKPDSVPWDAVASFERPVVKLKM